jgi:drug/metabolite transporter (DMT)-like permease
MRTMDLASLKENWNKHSAALGLFAATICWGASFFLVKEALPLVGIWPFLFWRFAMSCILMGAIFPQKLLNSRRTTMIRGLILGVLLFGALASQTQGLIYTTAGKSGFLTALYVPFIPVMGWVLFKQKISLRHFLVATLAVLGLYILTDTSSGGPVRSFAQWWTDINGGDVWTVFAALISAVHILFTEKYTRKESDSLALGLWQFMGCFGCVVLGTLYQYDNVYTFLPVKWNIMTWPTFAIGSAIFNAIFTTCFGFMMQIISQKRLGALKSALIFALEAPFSLFFAFLCLGEILNTKEFIGAGIVFLVSIVPDSWLRGQMPRGKNNGAL